ncbi:MAG: PIN domain-containing protein [Thermoanaerobacterales bacterium]|nr:PIN domain-containing protein [Thermoanaerobacterales bacterium]
MKVWVDTSALLAVLDGDDRHHDRARTVWVELLQSGAVLVLSSYMLVETCALVQRRLGLDALRVLHEDILPLVRVIWVDEEAHRLGATALLTANRRRLSLVDCVSFALMRRAGINEAFAFDVHFREQGFRYLAD